MLAPTLLLIYVNDLPDLLQGGVLLFADDVKLISARANVDDLQHDLYTAWDWTLTWDPPLNDNKCGQISVDSNSSLDAIRQRRLHKTSCLTIDYTF